MVARSWLVLTYVLCVISTAVIFSVGGVTAQKVAIMLLVWFGGVTFTKLFLPPHRL